jgi:hypothetical protein
VKSWPWTRICFGVACTLVVASVAPIAYLFWFGYTNNFQPLSMPFPLKQGEYASSFFKTDLNEPYQIFAAWHGDWGHPVTLDVDWKIVDDSGVVIQHGAKKYVDPRGFGNSVLLGQYQPTPGVRQRLILTNHVDSAGIGSCDPMLEVGVPEEGLKMAYGMAVAYVWAGGVGGAGVLMFLVLLIVRVIRPPRQAVTAL